MILSSLRRSLHEPQVPTSTGCVYRFFCFPATSSPFRGLFTLLVTETIVKPAMYYGSSTANDNHARSSTTDA